MPPLRSPRLLALAVAAVAVLPVLVAPPAAAEEAAASGETVVGELVQGYADPFPSTAQEPVEEHADSLVSWIRTDAGEAVRVPTEDVDDIAAGSTVEVVLGDAVQDEVAGTELAPAQEVLEAEVLSAPAGAAAPASAPVDHEVTVVMLQPAGVARDATSLADVMAVVNGAVADFWEQETDGAVRFGTVAGFDWTTQSTLTCSNPFALWNEAATRARWTGGPGKHLLVHVPSGSPGCAYGLGTIGWSIDEGGLAYVQAADTSVIAHEFGHNLGLGHSSALQCDRSVDVMPCEVAPYDDYHDVMGASWGQIGSLNAVHAARLGALSAHPVYWYPGSRTGFDLRPVSGTLDWRGIELISEDGTRHFVEHRPASGRDAWLGTSANWPGVDAGVQIRVASEGEDSSLLLDATPSPSSGWGADLQRSVAVGATVSLNDGEFLVTVQSVEPTMARVLVATRASSSEIDLAYRATGGAAGPLGRPLSSEVCGLAADGCRRSYAGGAIYWSPSTGAHVVRGAILARWRALRAESGPLGYPIGDDVAVPGGFKTDFAGGSVYWSASTGARIVRGAILQRYVAAGGPRVLGFPIADDGGTADGTGALVRLQGGAIYWSSRTGAHVVRGAILDRWRSLGAHTGVLGYPTGDDVAVPGGFKTDFAGGAVYWSASTGAHTVRRGILTHWLANGGPSGPLGFPVTDHAALADGSGSRVRFQNGVVTERTDGRIETTTG